MDIIYIPNLAHKLSIEDTISLSEIRVKLDTEAIDYQYSKNISRHLLSVITSYNREHIIDFGCGGGFLLNCIESNYGIKHYYGLDFAVNSISFAKLKQPNLCFKYQFQVFNKENKIELADNSVDSIISCFVMHFPIFDNQINELARVLKPSGQFVYNDFSFNKHPLETELIINKLIAKNFSVKTYIKSFRQNKCLKKHKIIIATKK